jgi:hypothetical protein
MNPTKTQSAHGRTAIVHNGHTDFLKDGHLMHVEGGYIVEHVIEVSAQNPDHCTADHPATGHDAAHVHGPGCGHEPVPHGNHIDYLVNGRLHHPHGKHCDDHGPVSLVSGAQEPPELATKH